MNSRREPLPLSPLPALSGGERQIGALLVDSGRISTENAEQILQFQKKRGIRFGEAAVQLGFISQEDLERVLALQYDYPYLTPGGGAVDSEVIAAYQPFSRQVEQLRALRSQLVLRWFTPEKRVLAVVSPSRGDGRSYIVSNLAVVFSQLGERTLLIDADMRHPRQHTLFGLDNSTGLSSILSGRSDAGQIKRIASFVDLSVLPAGPTPPNPQELLSRTAFADFINGIGHSFDVILLDTPAGDVSADAQTVAVRAGGVLVLGRKDQSSVRAIEGMALAIRQSGGQIVGSVLNAF